MIILAIMAIKASFKLLFKITKETINAAMPMATFNA